MDREPSVIILQEESCWRKRRNSFVPLPRALLCHLQGGTMGPGNRFIDKLAQISPQTVQEGLLTNLSHFSFWWKLRSLELLLEWLSNIGTKYWHKEKGQTGKILSFGVFSERNGWKYFFPPHKSQKWYTHYIRTDSSWTLWFFYQAILKEGWFWQIILLSRMGSPNNARFSLFAPTLC